jgi:hypothetical protein
VIGTLSFVSRIRPILVFFDSMHKSACFSKARCTALNPKPSGYDR